MAQRVTEDCGGARALRYNVRVIKIPIPDPPLDHVFSLTRTRHLFGKFAWEIREFEDSIKNPDDSPFAFQHPAYHAFNCAITAWHIADWVWKEAGDEWKALIAGQLGCKNDFNSFKSAVCEKHRSIKICQQIANGSKHMTLSRPEERIRAKVISKFSEGGNFSAELVVTDGEEMRPVLSIFKEAFDRWHDELSTWGFVEARAIFPDDE